MSKPVRVWMGGSWDVEEIVAKHFGIKKKTHDEPHPWKEKWDWEKPSRRKNECR